MGDRASDTLRRSILDGGIGRLLVQKGACQCSDACRCCQLPANALALSLDSLVVELRQNIHTLRSSLCILYSSTVSTSVHQPFLLVYFYIYVYVCVYIHTCYIYVYVCAIYIHVDVGIDIDIDICVTLSTYKFIYRLYFCFLIYVTAVILLYRHIFIYAPALLVLY